MLWVVLAAQANAADFQALILTGAASEAAGAPLLEAAKKRVEAAKDLLAFAPGFPKLVQSDAVPGLKPGFWIVIAGYCEKDTVLDALKAIDSGSYSRPVKVEAGACPKVTEGWSVKTDEAKDASKRTLRGVLFVPDDQGHEWKLYVSLKEKSGVLLAEEVLEQSKDSPCLYGGDSELKAKGATLVLKSSGCMKSRGCPNPGEATVTVTVSAVDQVIKTEGKVLKDSGYAGCRGE